MALISFYVFAIIHIVYTFVFLLAPRFLYRGKVWLKTLPWIISSFGLFLNYYFFQKLSGLKLIYCIFWVFLQSLQYIVCVLSSESALEVVFKPFSMTKVPNMLSNIDLTDPNANLESAFGPPIKVPSPIFGQAPTISRYGSQARNVIQNGVEIRMTDNVQQGSPLVQLSAPSASPLPPFAQTPQASPPVYSNNLPSYGSISHQNEKPRFNEKN